MLHTRFKAESPVLKVGSSHGTQPKVTGLSALFRKPNLDKPAACRAPTVSTQPAFISFFALVAITITARLLERVTKQITHHFDVIVARMVQARKPESTFDGFEQREVRVALRTLHTVNSIVRIHDR